MLMAKLMRIPTAPMPKPFKFLPERTSNPNVHSDIPDTYLYRSTHAQTTTSFMDKSSSSDAPRVKPQNPQAHRSVPKSEYSWYNKMTAITAHYADNELEIHRGDLEINCDQDHIQDKILCSVHPFTLCEGECASGIIALRSPCSYNIRGFKLGLPG